MDDKGSSYMQQTHWLDSPFEKDIYKANSILLKLKHGKVIEC
jgi:hypothetical protein